MTQKQVVRVTCDVCMVSAYDVDKLESGILNQTRAEWFGTYGTSRNLLWEEHDGFHICPGCARIIERAEILGIRLTERKEK